MQIDISNLPPEVESLHKLIATLHEKNNDWAFKYRELSKQNTTLTSQNTSLDSVVTRGNMYYSNGYYNV